MKLVLKYIFVIMTIIFLISIVSVTICAEQSYRVTSGVCGDDVKWTLYKQKNRCGYDLVISGTGAMTAYSEYNNQQPWYSYRTSIISVTIETGVTTIGDYAFAYCSNLTSVAIPDSITSICYQSFYGCEKLTSITIPYSVTNIGRDVFDNCTNLTNFIIDSENPNYSSDTISVLFNKDKTVLVEYYTNDFATEYAIPNSVTTIESSAFRLCASLETITIPDSVTSIGSYAFWKCTSLANITIPDGLTGIQEQSFYGCTNLKNVTIPNSVTTIGNSAFYDCDSLTNIIIPNSVILIENSAFYGCSSLENIILGNSVTNIGEWAFYFCTSLESITIPQGVTSIGEKSFYNCVNLKSIMLPKSITTIGNSAFYECDSLVNVTLPENLTYLGACAFEKCSFLENIIIPDNVTTIGNGAFRDCTNLTKVTIFGSQATIGMEAFYKCYNLSSLTIGDGVTSIESSAFYGCDSLINVIIPDSVTNIGYSAFCYCDSLISITIPKSVTTIGNSAFRYCKNLTIYGYYGSAASNNAAQNGIAFVTLDCGENALWTLHDNGELVIYGTGAMRDPFDSSSVPWHFCKDSIKSVTIEKGITTIGRWSFYSYANLTSVEIPDSVTTIKEGAFKNCTNLTSVIVYSKTTTFSSNAFYGCTNLTIHGYDGSVVEAYAITNNIPFVALKDNVDVTGIFLNKTALTLEIGQCDEITATVVPSNATNKNVLWKSSDTTVATIDNGVIKALSLGTTVITATTEDGSKSAICLITVRNSINFVGAQIRINAPQGLRFVFSIPRAKYDELSKPQSINDTGIRFGTVVMPKKYLGDNTLVKDFENIVNGKVYKAKTVPAIKIFNETDTEIFYTVCITNIAQRNYQNEYVAVPYVTYTDGKTVYGEMTENITVYSVAELAYADETTTEATKQYLYENILSVVDPIKYPKK